ncbi:unnamed protein product [Rotaria magnacalcarata]|uniref:Protein sleepless n=2 Tax=Rotaria magnacalcarata TaxID=392030 RepID=A0A816T0Z8_9BILA|nr:unnamed protein product [Rotaria magnacalcarata]CAF2091436.1 unnamed protein product [Rotaria magnacalcarata]
MQSVLSMHQLFIIVVLLVIGMHHTTALQCYSCSYDIPSCNDPFNSSATGVTTVSSNTSCWKIKGFSMGMTVAVRGTGNSGNDTIDCTNNGCNARTQASITAILCCCNTDFCNTAMSMNMNIAIVLAAIILTRLQH